MCHFRVIFFFCVTALLLFGVALTIVTTVSCLIASPAQSNCCLRMALPIAYVERVSSWGACKIYVRDAGPEKHVFWELRNFRLLNSQQPQSIRLERWCKRLGLEDAEANVHFLKSFDSISRKRRRGNQGQPIPGGADAALEAAAGVAPPDGQLVQLVAADGADANPVRPVIGAPECSGSTFALIALLVETHRLSSVVPALAFRNARCQKRALGCDYGIFLVKMTAAKASDKQQCQQDLDSLLQLLPDDAELHLKIPQDNAAEASTFETLLRVSCRTLFNGQSCTEDTLCTF